MGRSEAYRQFAVRCLELARALDSQHDRAVLLEMALLWSRLAERSMRPTAHKEDQTAHKEGIDRA